MNELIPSSRTLTPLGRRKTCDVAYGLNMPAGSPGDITRHFPPGTVEPCKMNAVTVVPFFGLAVVTNADGTVRLIQAGDGALTDIYGIGVRPYPFQPASATNYGAVGFGGGVPATLQPIDILRSGYILVPINTSGGLPVKGGTVYVWIAASAGGHVQGGFETAATGGSTIALPVKSTFQSGVDANGYGELAYNI